MTTLVVGASGATGRLLVRELLNRGETVTIIVRAPDKLPDFLQNQDTLSVIQASVLDLSDTELAQQVMGCDAVASCLGHNLTIKGIFGPPRRLVTQATRRLCHAIQANKPATPVKFVLMNTTGNRNRDLAEPLSLGHKSAAWLLRHLLPPQADNEQAADFLRTKIGQGNRIIEWAVVRPDGLIDEPEATPFEVHPSPIRDPIFDAGVTSRINVGYFMADLITDPGTWAKWKGQMPVLYNQTQP